MHLQMLLFLVAPFSSFLFLIAIIIMCIKPSKGSISRSKQLNPFADEWIHPLKSLAPFPPQPLPPLRLILPQGYSSPSLLFLPPAVEHPPLQLYYYSSTNPFILCYDAHSQPQPFYRPPCIPFPFWSEACFSGQTGSSVEIEELEAGKEFMNKEEKDDLNKERTKVARGTGVFQAKRRARKFPSPRTLIARKAPTLIAEAEKQISGGRLDVDGPPKEQDFVPPRLPSSSLTTIMMKNVPNQMRRNDLMNFLDSYCRRYNIEYDFLYLPMDFRTTKNLGYAFVNLTSAAAALKLKKLLHHYLWGLVQTEQGRVESKKICEIAWARIQGKEKLKKRFETSLFCCDRLDFLPVILNPPRNGSNSTSPPITVGRCIKQKID